MHRSFRTSHLWLLALLSLTACTYDKGPMALNIHNCRGISPSYHADIVPMIHTYCSDTANGPDCHHAGVLYDLTQYTVLADRIVTGHIEEHCIDSREMPPPYTLGPKTLPDDQIRLLNCWIRGGYLEN